MDVETRRQLISIIIPCYNEEEVLPETLRRLHVLCQQLSAYDIELLFIDDGSRDATRSLLRRFAEEDKRVGVIGFARNFGHQLAVSAGIDAAHGDALVIIDADLQDPPEVIPQMLAKWQEGYDVVYGVRTDRPGESAFKLLTAKYFYRTLNALSEVSIPLDAGDFRCISRRVADVLRSMPEKARFVRGMVSWIGFRQYPLPYRRAARFAGSTKYPLKKMLKFAADGLLSFSTKPLQLATALGFLCAMLAGMGIVWALGVRLLTNSWVEGWTTLLIAILGIGGVQLMCLGIIGEYIGRIYAETKQRPLYIVEERLGVVREESER